MCVCVCVCVCVCARARALSYVVFINLCLAIIVTCLNTFWLFICLCICLTLNYHTLNLNFIHLHVTVMILLKTNFLLRTIKYHLILLILSYCLFSFFLFHDNVVNLIIEELMLQWGSLRGSIKYSLANLKPGYVYIKLIQW